MGQKLNNWLGGLIICILIVGSIALFGYWGAPPRPSTTISSAPNPAPSPTLPLEQPYTSPDAPRPPLIPVAAGVLRASATQRLQPALTNIEQMFNYAVYQDTLVARVHLVDGGTALVEVDLTTGESGILLELPDRDVAGFNDLHVSAHFLAWLEAVPADNEQRLQILDRVTAEIFTLHQSAIRGIDLREGLVVWGELADGGLFAHDLTANQTYTVADKGTDARYAKVCSSSWVAYLRGFAPQERFVFTTSADLVLHHLPTGRELPLGRVDHVSTIPNERITNFACDEQRLAWIAPSETDPPQPEVHLFDLAAEQEQILHELQGDWKPYDNYLLLDGDILISRVGYDLAQQVPFTPLLDRSQRFGTFHIANNRLVWVENHTSGAGHIYIVPISRGEKSAQAISSN